MAAKNGDKVKVHYTGTLTSGEVFDSSVEREPLEFVLGQKQMIPAFEEAILDMEIGEKKTINIEAANAYGVRDDRMMQTVPRNMLPEDMKPEVGTRLSAQGPDGQVVHVVIAGFTDEEVMLDANHPLAGEDLTFDIELVAIA